MVSMRVGSADQFAETDGISRMARVPVGGRRGRRRGAHVALWVVQALLALIFLSAGMMKLALPIEILVAEVPLPGLFLKFVGLGEVLGAIGLILPGLLRIRPGLTPLAAAGLAIIMTGATMVTVAVGEVAPALIPLVVGLLAATVAYGRWDTSPTLF